MQGGLGGAEAFAKSAKLIDMLKKQRESSKPYGAMCASPALVLEHHGLLKVRRHSHALGFRKLNYFRASEYHLNSRVLICTVPWLSGSKGLDLKVLMGLNLVELRLSWFIFIVLKVTALHY